MTYLDNELVPIHKKETKTKFELYVAFKEGDPKPDIINELKKIAQREFGGATIFPDLKGFSRHGKDRTYLIQIIADSTPEDNVKMKNLSNKCFNRLNELHGKEVEVWYTHDKITLHRLLHPQAH